MSQIVNNIYNQYDSDSNKLMDRNEFRTFLQKQGINLSPQDFEATFRRYDADNSGKISLDEFQQHVRATGHTQQTTTQVRTTGQVVGGAVVGDHNDQHAKLFGQYDADGNREMDYDEFKNFMRQSGIQLNEQQAQSNFHYYDSNNDGKITLNDFRQHVHFKTPAPVQAPVPVPLPAPVAVQQTLAPQRRTGTVVTIESLFRQYAGAKGYLDEADVARFFAETGHHLDRQQVAIHLKYIGAQNGRVTINEFRKFVRQR